MMYVTIDGRRWRVDHYLARGRLRMYPGDNSERCVVCGSRGPASYYVGQTGMLTDERLPERFPVCGDEHAKLWMKHVWLDELEWQDYAF